MPPVGSLLEPSYIGAISQAVSRRDAALSHYPRDMVGYFIEVELAVLETYIFMPEFRNRRPGRLSLDLSHPFIF